MDNLEETFKNENIKVRYYYRNDPIIGNIFTTCILLSGEKILARGICICSLLDSHDKKFAREKSKSRALAALFKKKNSLPINGDLDEGNKRYYSDVEKSFKLKNKALKEELVEHLKIMPCDYKISKSEDTERLHVYIPYLLPVVLTNEVFEYKSSYNPEATDDEKKMFKVA